MANDATTAPKYQPSKQLLDRIHNDFTYHPPKGDQLPRYARIRDRIRELAEEAVTLCPEGRELSIALTHLEEASFYFNASIARNE